MDLCQLCGSLLNLSPELVGEFLLLLIVGNVVQLQQGIDFQETELTGEVSLEVLENEAPRVKLKVPRNKIPEILSSLLAKYRILDVGVQERPLEEVIAEVFTEHKETSDYQQAQSLEPTTTK